LPSTLFLMVAGQAVVALLYQYGRFTPLDTVNTASALLFYSIGLFAFSSTRVAVSIFYSFQDAKTPVKISVITVAFNIAANLLLMKPLGFQGMALAASLSGCLNLILLILALKKKTGSLDVRRLGEGFLQSLLASAGMALCLWLFQRYVSGDLLSASLTQKLWQVLLLLIVSAASYLLFSKLFNSRELGQVTGILKFKKSR
ncbi:MAG: polysaccharide biosynthesis C-terminal domain-containing protein, partial [candidate division Zixibacteria bacterium]|nr:polysaccharide biosynthesis C-terminal domain-containing protein [candidate division Zixibacteria bacterium]